MSIADTIQSMQTNLSNAYDALTNKYIILPDNKNLENLSKIIQNIYIPYTLGLELQNSSTLVDAAYISNIGSATDTQILKLPNYWGTKPIKRIGTQAFLNNTNITHVYIDDNIIQLGAKCFAGCSNLEYVLFYPNSMLNTLEYHAFQNCHKLKSIALPKTVNTIGNATFQQCYNLTEIDLSNVQTIGAYTFSDDDKLNKVTFSSNLQFIGNYAFSGTALREITMLATTPPELGGASVFRTDLTKIIVPIGCKQSYIDATNWSAYANIIEEAVS